LSNTSNGSVLRLMHHRSSACSYYNEPRATLSPTGRYVLFTSDWASPNCSDQGDLYLIDTTPFLDAFLGGIAPPVDAGLPDTGVVPPFDSGVPFPDVGFDDGGLPIDAGFADTGISPDSGGPGPSDAGSADRVIRDGSSTPRGDDDDELRGGCGCDTRAPGSSGSVFGLLLVAGLLFRRRL
jgi:MYXO-CTERM domain-containing protein